MKNRKSTDQFTLKGSLRTELRGLIRSVKGVTLDSTVINELLRKVLDINTKVKTLINKL